MSALRVVVIGAGPVGRALARAWQTAGDQVSIAVRQPLDGRHDGYRDDHLLVPLESLPEADATVLAVPGAALGDLVDSAGSELDGRLIVDATNRVGDGPMHQLGLLSGGLPSSEIFRAFTTVGWENFEPSIAGARPDMLWSGPPAGAGRTTVEALIAHTGMRPVWAGDGEQGAGVLDAATRLWFGLAFGAGLGRHLGFRIVGAQDSP